MNKIIILTVFSLVTSMTAFANEIRSIKLNNTTDNERFNKVLVYLGSGQRVVDPLDSTIVYDIREYVAKSGGVKFSCSAKIQEGIKLSPNCVLEFNLAKSSDELEVFTGKLAGALVAKFNVKSEATQINHGTGLMSLVAFEKVNIRLPNGNIQPTPRLRIDCDKIDNSGGVANSCTLVAIPDQSNN